MRLLVPELASPSPLLTRLPAILQEDEFLERALPAFDAVIAPVYATLDNLDAYVRPEYAPADFLEWLAGWVDIAIDEAWSEEQRRRIVADAVGLHRRVGTAGGIRDALQLAAGPGATVDVEESGGTSWSTEPGAALPGSAEAGVAISITMPAGDGADQAGPPEMADTAVPRDKPVPLDPAALTRRLERVAAQVVPAHVPVRVTVNVPPSATDAAS